MVACKPVSKLLGGHMSEVIAWSFNAGTPSGSIDNSGSFSSDAVVAASVTLDAAGTKALDLQMADLTKVKFVAVKSSLYNGKVTIKASGTGATEIALTGPVVLFGAAVALLGPSLDTLTVKNTDAGTSADIEILIACNLI
jgi:hypothetical protein